MTARDVSVIVVCYNAARHIAACLEALARQTAPGFETIVVDSSTDATPEIVRRDFPWARLLHFERRHYPGDARNAGLREARGGIIAFVDSDCLAAPDWIERIAAAHAGPRLIAGGSVGVANPESLAGWGSYFCEFSNWLPAGEPREMPDIPTCCLSFKREAFDRFGPFLEGSYCSDTVFHWRAGAAGHLPLFVPAIHVSHRNPTELRKLWAKHRMHGETFAIVRVREKRWSRARALAMTLGAPLLPLAIGVKIAARAARAPGYRLRFLRALPFVAAGLVHWAWGEARGYWTAARGRELDHRAAAQRAS